MPRSLPRDIGASVLAYAVMTALAFVLFSLTWAVLGAEGSFRPGVWEVSSAWIAASLCLGFIVSATGGFTAAKVGSSVRAVHLLVGLVILFGILQAMPETAPGASRPDGVSMFEAMSSLQQPRWLFWVNPVVGVVAVLVGARLAGRS